MKNPRIRIHISPETLQELTALRKARGCRSWEEFLTEMINKASGLVQAHPNMIESFLKQIQANQSELKTHLHDIRTTLQATHSGADPESQLMNTMLNIRDVLSLALQTSHNHFSEAPPTREAKPLSRIQQRLLKQGL